MKKNPKILICGGGTGGHIYPAISIIDSIKQKLIQLNNPGCFLFIGSFNNPEIKEVENYGYKIKKIWISSMPKKIFNINTLIFPFKIIYSYITSNAILNKFQPDLIIGTGGYVSWIPIHVAYYKNIPIVIQEQNVIPGNVNKHIGNYMAKKIFISYKQTLKFFPINKTIITGNPIRHQILHKKYNKIKICKKLGLNPYKKIILSIGGSLGAQSINNFWIKNINNIINKNIQLIWQTGKKNFNKIKKLYLNKKNTNLIIYKYIKNIELVYFVSDIIISRAGGVSISEISIFSKPVILIPLPTSAKNHQVINAEMLYKINAALIVYDHEIQHKLLYIILFLIKNKKIQKKLSNNINKINKPDANYNIVKEIIKLL